MVYVIQVCWQLASRIGILLTSCQQTCMTYTIAVCTANNSRWWTEKLKHLEFHSKNKFEKLVHLVGFVMRNLTWCMVTWTYNSSVPYSHTSSAYARDQVSGPHKTMSEIIGHYISIFLFLDSKWEEGILNWTVRAIRFEFSLILISSWMQSDLLRLIPSAWTLSHF
jgi:hypothetical protein